MEQLTEVIASDIGVSPQDIATADVTGPWYPAAMYRRFLAAAVANQVDTTKVLTVQLMQATDNSGTGAKALSAVVSVAAAGTQDLEAAVSAHVHELDLAGGFDHVAVKLTCDSATAKDGAAVLLRTDGRFSE